VGNSGGNAVVRGDVIALQRRQIGEATAALTDAEQLAPEHVRAHHHVRQALEDLLAQAGNRPPVALVELAKQVGVIG
jgi:hypothetical protein